MENKKEIKVTESLSIVALVLSCKLPLIGLVLSIIGLSEAKKNNTDKACAVAGIVIASLSFAVKLLLILFVIAAVSSVNNISDYTNIYQNLIPTYY